MICGICNKQIGYKQRKMELVKDGKRVHVHPMCVKITPVIIHSKVKEKENELQR